MMSLLSICFLISVSCLSVNQNESPDEIRGGVFFSEKHSYYEITDVIDLERKTIILPEGAVVDFRGGYLKNGKLECRNNSFKGRAGFANDVSLSGSVLGPMDLDVFQLKRDDRDFDFGKIINGASEVCKNLIIPDGLFYFQTPIKIEDIRCYQQYGDLIYNGKAKSVTVFQFFKGNASNIAIYGKIAYDINTKVINYTKTNQTHIIGIEFVNLNNSNVLVSDVEYFNNNIRVSAYGAGNCYNKYTFNISVFSNEHLRIYQKNQPANQIGWCNENVFIGGRFCNWSHFDWNKCESVAIKIEGDEKNDTYNSANSLLFIKPCMEGFKDCAVFAKNVIGCHWQDTRTEGSKVFIRFDGSCRDNEANTMYGTEVIDYLGCSTYPLKMAGLFPVYSTSSTSSRLVVDVNTSTTKRFRVMLNGQDAKGRIGIQYLTDNHGNAIAKSKQKSMTHPRSSAHPNSFYFNDNSSIWMLASDSIGSDFVVPENVDKIQLTITGKHSGITIYSDQIVQVTEK